MSTAPALVSPADLRARFAARTQVPAAASEAPASSRPVLARGIAHSAGPAKAQRTNQHPGNCVSCGIRVEAGKGHLARNRSTEKWEVSCALDAASQDACLARQAAKAAAPSVVPSTAPTAPSGRPFTPRPNKYAAKCADCRRNVPEGAGRLSKTDEGKWEVRHLDGECAVSDFPFPYGGYALEVEGVVKFYEATEDGLFAKASNDLFPVTTGAPAVIEAIAADPKAASARYGIELEVCGRCGRDLTSEWRKVGLGPVCANKAW